MSYRVIIIAPPTHFPVGLKEFFEEYPHAVIEIYHPEYADLRKYFFWGYLIDIIEEYDPRLSIHYELDPKNYECDLYLEVAEVKTTPEKEKEFPVHIWPLSQGSIDLQRFLRLPNEKKEELWEIQKQHYEVARSLQPRLADADSQSSVSSIDSQQGEHPSTDSPWWTPEQKKSSRWDTDEKEDSVFRNYLVIPENLSGRVEQAHLNCVEEVIALLMGERPLSRKRQGELKVKHQADALDWFHQFCEANKIPENAVWLRGLIEKEIPWPKIKGTMQDHD